MDLPTIKRSVLQKRCYALPADKNTESLIYFSLLSLSLTKRSLSTLTSLKLTSMIEVHSNHTICCFIQKLSMNTEWIKKGLSWHGSLLLAWP